MNKIICFRYTCSIICLFILLILFIILGAYVLLQHGDIFEIVGIMQSYVTSVLFFVLYYTNYFFFRNQHEEILYCRIRRRS